MTADSKMHMGCKEKEVSMILTNENELTGFIIEDTKVYESTE